MIYSSAIKVQVVLLRNFQIFNNKPGQVNIFKYKLKFVIYLAFEWHSLPQSSTRFFCYQVTQCNLYPKAIRKLAKM